MDRFDGVVIGSVRAAYNYVWFVAGEYYGDDDLFAAYRYDKDTDTVNVLVSMADYDKCLAVIGASMIGLENGVEYVRVF